MSNYNQSDRDQSENDPDDEPASRPPRGALLGLLLVVVLIGAVMFIMHRLRQADELQDCVASGRTNCAPVETKHQ